jgi:predicted nucleotidyltransferase
MTRFDALLVALSEAKVEFIVIGGVAGIVHGAATFTKDLDVVYARNAENLSRLVAAIAPHAPYLRGAAPGLPFRWDVSTLHAGLNFTLSTDLGEFDMLGEVTGGGRYEDLLPHTLEIEAFGVRCRCVTLRKLIQLKRAAGRPRDLNAIAELEALLEEQERSG